MSEKKLTPKEAALRAGVSLSLIYQWCEERRLAHYRVGGRSKRGKLLIAPSDLDRFMETLKVEAHLAAAETADARPAAPPPKPAGRGKIDLW